MAKKRPRKPADAPTGRSPGEWFQIWVPADLAELYHRFAAAPRSGMEVTKTAVMLAGLRLFFQREGLLPPPEEGGAS